MLISLLKKFTKGRDLIRLGVTRFATTYLTLGCLHELKASLLTMFNFEEWNTSKFGTSQEGKRVERVVLGSRFLKNVSTCSKATVSPMVVLSLVALDVNPQWVSFMKRWTVQRRRSGAILTILRRGKLSN